MVLTIVLSCRSAAQPAFAGQSAVPTVPPMKDSELD